MSLTLGSRRSLLRNPKRIFHYDPRYATMTPSCAIRDGDAAGMPFKGVLYPSGLPDGTGVPDELRFVRGDALGNLTDYVRTHLDPYQGCISFWVIPSWDGDDGIQHYIFDCGSSANILILKSPAGNLQFYAGGQLLNHAITTWTAGTLYLVSASWDSKNPISGANHARVGVDNAFVYGMTTAPVPAQPSTNIQIGNNGSPASGADCLIGGLCISRRVLTADDGTGKNVGKPDELGDIYNGGAGDDPLKHMTTQDIVMCAPTNSTPGALTTGSLHLWTHPLKDSLIDDTLMSLGRLPGGKKSIEFNGTNTSLNCGSDVDIDDIPTGIFTADIYAALNDSDGRLIIKNDVGIGWGFSLSTDGALRGWALHAVQNASSLTPAGAVPIDGKRHSLTMLFNQGIDDLIYFAVDGVWVGVYTTQDDAQGAYVGDAAVDLYIGSSVFGEVITGSIAWAAISNNDRHTVGTDFEDSLSTAIPTDDVNYLAIWPMEEGTGGTVDNIGNQGGAGSGAANRDGTLTNGSWSNIWSRVLTPVEPVALEFVGDDDGINFQSGVNLDNLPLADCTIEFYARIPVGWSSSQYIMAKVTGGAGWYINNSGSDLRCGFVTDGSFGQADIPLSLCRDDVWHHFAYDWEQAALTLRGLFDGVLINERTGTGVYQVDAALDFLVNASTAIGTGDGAFAIGPIRISSTRRYTDDHFVPPPMADIASVWTLPDADTQLQTEMRDGTGTTVTDDSVNGYDGTITLGNGTRWLNTTEASVIALGARLYNEGQVIYSDQVNDGVEIVVPIDSTPVDLVILPRISVTGPQARWSIVVNGVTFLGPLFTGAHDGGAAAQLTDADAKWVQQMVDAEFRLFNITAGTVATPTAINGDGDLVTGGPVFDNGEVYMWMPPAGRNWSDYPIGDAGIFVTTVHTGTEVTLQVLNPNGAGGFIIHQMEVQKSLLINGDMETFGVIADTRTINVGTETGTLSSTEVQDGSDWIINEVAATPGFDVEVTFEVPTGCLGDTIYVYGYYNGTLAHTVNVDVYNHDTTSWDTLGQLPDAVADTLYPFALDDAANQIDGTTVTIRFQHTSAGNVTHDLIIDYLWLSTDPAIPRGWTNVGLDVGDAETEGTVVHSGAQSWQLNVGATNDEYAYSPLAILDIGDFSAWGGWFYGDGTVNLRSVFSVGASLAVHDRASTAVINWPSTAKWRHYSRATRCAVDTPLFRPVDGRAGASGARYTSDQYLIPLNPIELTVTPQSRANSTDANGRILVNGYDQLVQDIPPGWLTAKHGHIRFHVTFLHGDLEWTSFNATPVYILHVFGDADNNIYVRVAAAPVLQLRYAALGVSSAVGQWNTGGGVVVPAVRYTCDIIYTPSWMRLYLDGEQRIELATGPSFAWPDSTIAYWLSSRLGGSQIDAIIG